MRSNCKKDEDCPESWPICSEFGWCQLCTFKPNHPRCKTPPDAQPDQEQKPKPCQPDASLSPEEQWCADKRECDGAWWPLRCARIAALKCWWNCPPDPCNNVNKGQSEENNCSNDIHKEEDKNNTQVKPEPTPSTDDRVLPRKVILR